MLCLTLAAAVNLAVFAGCSILWCRADLRSRRIPNRLLLALCGSFSSILVLLAVMLLLAPQLQAMLVAAGIKWVTAFSAGAAVTVVTVLCAPAAVGRGDLKLLGLLVMQLLWYGNLDSIAGFLLALTVTTLGTLLLTRGVLYPNREQRRDTAVNLPAAAATTRNAIAYAPALTVACWSSLAVTWLTAANG